MTQTSKFNQISCVFVIVFILVSCISIAYRINYNPFSTVLSMTINKYQNTLLKTLRKEPDDGCQWQFDHYSPSPWEMYWYSNIADLQNRVCGTLQQNDQFSKSTQTLDYIITLQKSIFKNAPVSDKYDELFSQMHYRLTCSDSSKSRQNVSQYIEPLIGLLRDPLTICQHQNLPSKFVVSFDEAVQSKRFFLLGPSAPYRNFQKSTTSIPPWLRRQGSQTILFDIGASLFSGTEHAGQASPLVGTRWFYEYFRLHSLYFDHIIAFEASQYAPKTYWSQIPNDIIGLLTFINVPVEKQGKFNPWNILKSMAKPDDYVIIKLDIDTYHLENELMQQILNDTNISSLIDEMFFEMHITVSEMRMFWGAPGGELKDTYVLFTKLRQLGIRMHSWP